MQQQPSSPQSPTAYFMQPSGLTIPHDEDDNHMNGDGGRKSPQSPTEQFTSKIMANDTLSRWQFKKRPSAEQVFSPRISIVEEIDGESDDDTSSDDDPQAAVSAFYGVELNENELPGTEDEQAKQAYNGSSDDEQDENRDDSDDKLRRGQQAASDDELESYFLSPDYNAASETNNDTQTNDENLRNVLTALFVSITKIFKCGAIDEQEKYILKNMVVQHDANLLEKTRLFLLSENFDGLQLELQRIAGVCRGQRVATSSPTIDDLLTIDEQEEFVDLYMSNARYLFASIVGTRFPHKNDVASLDDVGDVLSRFDLSHTQAHQLQSIVEQFRVQKRKEIDFELFLRMCLDLDVNLILPSMSEPASPTSFSANDLVAS